MASIFLRFPEGRSKALTLSYDDGVEQDKRLIEIMNKHGLKGTFNLNSGLFIADGDMPPKGCVHRRMTKKKFVETFRNSGQEIAAHTLTHPSLELLPLNMVVNEIIKDRENLEKMFNTIVRGMAYPYGTTNDSIVSVLKNCGIVYARTVFSTNDFGIPNDWMRIKATCHHNAPELLSLAKKFVEDTVTRTPYLFYLWGHSYEFEADDNWNVIEEFAEYMGNRNDVWYATNIQIYDYIDAFNRLVFSVDGKRVKNPSNLKIWFEYAGKMIAVDRGEIVETNVCPIEG